MKSKAPPYKSPQDAVIGLIEAYRTLDVDEIVQSKDFYLDSRIFWDGLGLPISPEKIAESQAAFETNFRKEMNGGIPDYRSVAFHIISDERPQHTLAVVTLAGLTADKQTIELRIPVFRTNNGWKVVLHPGYDRL